MRTKMLNRWIFLGGVCLFGFLALTTWRWLQKTGVTCWNIIFPCWNCKTMLLLRTAWASGSVVWTLGLASCLVLLVLLLDNLLF